MGDAFQQTGTGLLSVEKDASGGSGPSRRQDAHGRVAVGLGIVLGVFVYKVLMYKSRHDRVH
jgi:hypothetical protein